MAEITEDPSAAATAYEQMAMGAMFDLATPQGRYLELIANGGFVRRHAGHGAQLLPRQHRVRVAPPRAVLVVGGHEHRQHPADDPAQRRSSDHSKYRKLLDPLFAPQRMDEQEEDITRRVNGFIDTFIDRGECNFTEEFAELFPSSVFLGLMGCRKTRCACSFACRISSSGSPIRPRNTDDGNSSANSSVKLHSPAIDERVDEAVHPPRDVVFLLVHPPGREQRVEELPVLGVHRRIDVQRDHRPDVADVHVHLRRELLVVAQHVLGVDTRKLSAMPGMGSTNPPFAISSR